MYKFKDEDILYIYSKDQTGKNISNDPVYEDKRNDVRAGKSN